MARRGSASCEIQEVFADHDEQQTGFGSPVDPAMGATSIGFGSPVNTESTSAHPSADNDPTAPMPASGSPLGSVAGAASDSQSAADSMIIERLAASTAGANTEAQLGPSPQGVPPIGLACCPFTVKFPAASTLQNSAWKLPLKRQTSMSGKSMRSM